LIKTNNFSDIFISFPVKSYFLVIIDDVASVDYRVQLICRIMDDWSTEMKLFSSVKGAQTFPVGEDFWNKMRHFVSFLRDYQSI